MPSGIRGSRPKLTCAICGLEFLARSAWEMRRGRRCCSNYCAQQLRSQTAQPKRGADHPMWKGGQRALDSQGYVTVWTPTGRMREHRWIMIQALGRDLERSEHVHHLNHNRQDNRIENLTILASGAHTSHHLRVAWAKKKFTGPCTRGGRADRKHYAKSLCHPCYERNRMAPKRKGPCPTKLNATAVQCIRNSGETGASLAAMFGVSQSTICDIRARRPGQGLT